MSSYVLWRLDPALTPGENLDPEDRSTHSTLTPSELADLRQKKRAGGESRRAA